MPNRLDPDTVHVEHVFSTKVPRKLAQDFQESSNGNPTAIFPEIRVITADRPTLNKTFYPAESLQGKPSKGTGLISFVRPYAIPIIQDHNTGNSACGEKSSEIYGRIYRTPQLVKSPEESFLKAIPRVVHPEAIEGIMSGRWLTVSLGCRTDSVRCNICDQELTEEFCEHEKGRQYEIGEGKEARKVMAMWVIGPIKAKEVSFVVTPADESAGVMVPDLALRESATAGCGSLMKLLARNRTGVFDLMTGQSLKEHYSGIPDEFVERRANFYFIGWSNPSTTTKGLQNA